MKTVRIQEKRKKERKKERESENTADKEEDPADSDEENVEENEQNDDTDKSEASAEDALKELSYKIFAAQREEDYDFLEDKLSKGASLDKGSNTFTFDNVDYPHEMEFVQTEEDNIEYRYIHEVDADTIIVGFGIVDKKTELSFTIDFEYIKENGEWKMNDMDKNA